MSIVPDCSSIPATPSWRAWRLAPAPPWVLVFSGMINDAVQVRLRVYADILRESLNDVLTTITSRIVAELSRRHVPQNEPVERGGADRAGTALDRRWRTSGGLVVTTTTGRQALAVGNGDLLSSLDRSRGTRLLVRSSDAGGVMTVVFEREHTAFTAFEREIAQAGVAAMQPWIEAALPRSSDIERRGSARPVETDVRSARHRCRRRRVSMRSMIVMTIDASMVVARSAAVMGGPDSCAASRRRSRRDVERPRDRRAAVWRIGRSGGARELAAGAAAGISRRHSGIRSPRRSG